MPPVNNADGSIELEFPVSPPATSSPPQTQPQKLTIIDNTKSLFANSGQHPPPSIFNPPPASQPTEISFPNQATEGNKICKGCNKTFPRNISYFFKSKGDNVMQICKICYMHKLKDQGLWDFQDPIMGVPEKSPRKSVLRDAPWIKASEAAQAKAQQLPPQQASTSQPQQPKDRVTLIKEFKLDRKIEHSPEGPTVIMNNYLKFDPSQVKSKQVVQRKVSVKQSPADQVFSKPEPIPQPVQQPTCSSSPQQDEEESEDDFAEAAEDSEQEAPKKVRPLRDELFLTINAYPDIAQNLQLDFNAVFEMTDEEMENALILIRALSSHSSITHVLQFALTITSSVIEGYAVEAEALTSRDIDLTGYAESISQDKDIERCLARITHENAETLEEISPEMELAILMLGKGLMVSNDNKKKKRLLKK